MADTLQELASRASDDAIRLAHTVLEQDVADRAWAEQVGSCLTQRDVARLLGKTEQAVSQDTRLLRLHNRDGRPVYPVVQFEGRRMLSGVSEVVRTLEGAVEPLTVASWLTAPNRALEGRRPVDALGDAHVEAVVSLARRFARRASV